MEQKKGNSSVWYFAALALLLCIAFFVISVSPAFARYRDEITNGVVFEVREPEHICFGNFDEEKNFVPFTEGEDLKWEVSGNKATLTLTVANGTSGKDLFSKDQKIKILLAAGPEFGERTVSLGFTEGETEKNFSGRAAEIEEGSTFDKSYGAGFLFSFFENETEFFYILEGGKFSYLTFTITVDAEGLDGISFLQPHITAEVTE